MIHNEKFLNSINDEIQLAIKQLYSLVGKITGFSYYLDFTDGKGNLDLNPDKLKTCYNLMQYLLSANTKCLELRNMEVKSWKDVDRANLGIMLARGIMTNLNQLELYGFGNINTHNLLNDKYKNRKIIYTDSPIVAHAQLLVDEYVYGLAKKLNNVKSYEDYKYSYTTLAYRYTECMDILTYIDGANDNVRILGYLAVLGVKV